MKHTYRQAKYINSIGEKIKEIPNEAVIIFLPAGNGSSNPSISEGLAYSMPSQMILATEILSSALYHTTHSLTLSLT